jgi:hypothetical protein
MSDSEQEAWQQQEFDELKERCEALQQQVDAIPKTDVGEGYMNYVELANAYKCALDDKETLQRQLKALREPTREMEVMGEQILLEGQSTCASTSTLIGRAYRAMAKMAAQGDK